MTSQINQNEIDTLINNVGVDDFNKLLNAFFSECNSKLVSMGSNAAKANHDLLELETHTLKSVSRTFGAIELGDACSALEQAACNQDSVYYLPLYENIKTASNSAIAELREKYH